MSDPRTGDPPPRGLATPATYGNVSDLAARLALPEDAYRRAMALARLVPDGAHWERYADRFLAAAGGLLIAAGIAAFFAWNWADLHRLWKLALIQGVFLLALALAWRLGIDRTGGRASLLTAAMLVGVLFAVFGQVYQTGADPYGLFMVWAALVLPMAAVGRQVGLWLLFQVLVNVTVILYWIQVLNPPAGAWTLSQLLGPLVWLGSAVTDWRLASILFGVNAAAVAAWELAANRGAAWLQSRLFPRTVAFMALYTVLTPTMIMIIAASADAHAHLSVVSPLSFAAAAATGVWFYQRRRFDLFMLTLVLFGGVLVVMSLAIRHLYVDAGSLLLLAMLLVGLLAGAAAWLRRARPIAEGPETVSRP